MLKQAWTNGQPTREERSMLEVVRMSLGITDIEHSDAEHEIQREAYSDAIRLAWSSGVVTGEESPALDNLRRLFGISTEEQLAMEQEILREYLGDGNNA
jgi:hypothetical protein